MPFFRQFIPQFLVYLFLNLLSLLVCWYSILIKLYISLIFKKHLFRIYSHLNNNIITFFNFYYSFYLFYFSFFNFASNFDSLYLIRIYFDSYFHIDAYPICLSSSLIPISIISSSLNLSHIYKIVLNYDLAFYLILSLNFTIAFKSYYSLDPDTYELE